MVEKKSESTRKDVNIEQSSVDAIAAENFTGQKLGIRSLNAGKVDISQAGIGFMSAHEVNLDKTTLGILKAKNIQADRINSLICVADNVEGEVKSVFTKEGAAVFGAVFAFIMLFFRAIRRYL